MAYDAWADYVIYFSTPEKANFAISFIGAQNNIRVKPSTAAAMFGLVFPPVGGPLPDDGFIFQNPYLLNTNILHPGPSGVLLDGSLDDFFVPRQPPGPGFPAGDDMVLHWVASIIVRGPEYTGADPTQIAPIPPRRWAIGWEGSSNMECHPVSGTGNRARDASRVVDGIGLKYRSEVAGNTIECTLASSEGAGLPTRMSWERFYLRVRNVGPSAGLRDVWRCTGTASPNSGARLQINADGSLTAFNVNNVSVSDATFGSTPVLTANTWYKVDILVTFATGIFNGTFRLYLNGTLIISASQGTGSTGLGQIQNHRSSLLGGFDFTSGTEFDIDDWHNADIPNIAGAETLNSLDWLIGTHVRASFVVSGVSTNWTGILAAINQFPNATGSSLNLQATIAGSTITGLTNLSDYGTAETQDATGVTIGPATVAVSIAGIQAGGAPNDGLLGYKVAGGAAVLTATPMLGFNAIFTRTYLPSGSITPYPVNPFSVVYQKGAAASNATVSVLSAFCQYIGVWGIEDTPVDDPVTPEFAIPILHNCRYSNTFWANVGPNPDGPVCVVSRRYTGNGTFQTITPPGLAIPFHILVIRNLSSATPPVIVTTTMITPQSGAIGDGLAGDVPIIGMDPITFLPFFQVVGNGARVNQNAVDYEYFIFADPALRFSIMGEFNHGAQTATYNNLLIDGTFVPQFGIFQANPGLPGGLWFKGPSHTGFEVSTVNGALVSDAVQFQMGNIPTQGGISEGTNATAYSLFRATDGSTLVMTQVISYIGDGTASRVIPLTPASGRFPLVVFVTRRGAGQTYYRDAGHAGVNSCPFPSGGSSAGGIIGGAIDSITVGSTINVNGALYDVLCFPGTASGWTEGTYCGPNGIPPGDFWEPDPPELPPSVGEISEGGLTLGATNPITLLKDVSGIYTLTPGKRNDTFYDRQAGQTSIDMEIPDPRFKTGYIGG